MSFFDISWDKKHNKMESRGKKQGRFSCTLKTYVSNLFQIKGTIRGKQTTISISPSECNNYISDEFANELVIPYSNISERLEFWKKQRICNKRFIVEHWRLYQCLAIYS